MLTAPSIPTPIVLPLLPPTHTVALKHRVPRSSLDRAPGPVGYSASSTSLRNWIADVMGDLTGVERSDALSAGPADESAADVVRISALGDDWDAQLTGLAPAEPVPISFHRFGPPHGSAVLTCAPRG